MLYYDKRWMTVRFDESAQAVLQEWKGYAEGEEYRSGLDVLIDLMRQKNSCRLLADCRQLGPIAQVDQHWTRQDWEPRAVAAGLRFVAIVSPKAAVARLSIKQMVAKVNNIEVTTNHFDDLESARAWLRNATR